MNVNSTNLTYKTRKMVNENIPQKTDSIISQKSIFSIDGSSLSPNTLLKKSLDVRINQIQSQAEILFITSFPPRQCGIATYSQNLITALNNKFSNSLSIKICALENGKDKFEYPDDVIFTLDTSRSVSYMHVAEKINSDDQIQLILIQHEFGFYKDQEPAFLQLLNKLNKPVVVVFHTVLPNPDARLKSEIKNIVAASKSIIVMTNSSSDILINDYGISKHQIKIIAHGTHLVQHLSEKFLKNKYGLTDRKVLTTFGLLSSGKSIETTLDALPKIIQQCPEVIFLIIGKTHPEVVKNEGEVYRKSLIAKVKKLGIHDHVKFINKYLSLSELLEYLQLTDIYLFTSNDPNQAVSGTFVYAMSCGCPIISTPIPHAKEVLTEDTGIIFDFSNSEQLSDAVNRILNDDSLRKRLIVNTLQKIVSTVWENSAMEHARLFKEISGNKIQITFNLPVINLNHIKAMTTEVGMIQYSNMNEPDINSGYTLDDNAAALVAICMYYKLTGEIESIDDIQKYLSFIKSCQQPAGNFLNYMDQEQNFTNQNQKINLEESNARAIWALGYVVSLKEILPKNIIADAISIFEKAMVGLQSVKSPRAMSFIIKGIFFFQKDKKSNKYLNKVFLYANHLLAMYKQESNFIWKWYESYMSYANSIMPEAMHYAWLMTGEEIYKDIARISFNFLLSLTFNNNGIEVVSNKGWLIKGESTGHLGEQPVDVAYTIMSLSKFYDFFKNEEYHRKMDIAFNWFLGNNRLHQIIYNPITGGCYDGLEETHVNLNQGAESTLSYLLARLTVDKYKNQR